MSIHSAKHTNENYTWKNKRNYGTRDENEFWIRNLLEVVADIVLTTILLIKEIKK